MVRVVCAMYDRTVERALSDNLLVPPLKDAGGGQGVGISDCGGRNQFSIYWG